jgi:L-methionine (R)-S-oxide reductase
MADDLIINAGTKEERYQQLYPQLEALLSGEADLTANLANFCAALKYGMNFFWVGFYLVKDNALVLGPFQGPVACTRIQKGKGVCGTAWEKQKTVIVDDVDKFPGHISCSSFSKSEIVVPVYNSKKEMIGVLDVDSDAYSSFDETDEVWLKKMLEVIK